MRNLLIGAVFISILVAGCTAQLVEDGRIPLTTTLQTTTTVSVTTTTGTVNLEKLSDSPLTYKLKDSPQAALPAEEVFSATEFYPQVKQVSSALFPGYCLSKVSASTVFKDSGKLTGKALIWDYEFYSSGKLRTLTAQKRGTEPYYKLSLSVSASDVNPQTCINFDNFIDSTVAGAKASSEPSYSSSATYSMRTEPGKWVFSGGGTTIPVEFA